MKIYFMLLIATNQQFICCRLHAFSIYLHVRYFTNDLSKQFLVFAGIQLRRTDKSWQMREINGISVQDALSIFTEAICTYGSEFLVQTDFRQNRMKCTSVSYIYQSMFEINSHRASQLSRLSGPQFHQLKVGHILCPIKVDWIFIILVSF